MIIRHLQILIFALMTPAVIGCNSERKVNDNVDSTASVNVKIQELPKINLPFSSFCGENLIQSGQKETIVDSLPGNLRVAGVLKQTKTFTALLLVDSHADVQIHYLATVNNKKEIIEKFKLFSQDCTKDEFYKTKSRYTVDTALKISQIDTSDAYKRTDSGEIIKSSIIRSVNKHEFFVDKNERVKQFK